MIINTYQKLSNLLRIVFLLIRVEYRVEKIPYHLKNLHSVFHDLKEEYPDYFFLMQFDSKGSVPYSHTLESILGDFMLGDILNTDVPFYNYLLITDKAELPDLLVDLYWLPYEDIQILTNKFLYKIQNRKE